MLRTQLEKLCGADGFQVTVIPNEYLLTLQLTDKNKNHLLSLTDLLRRMIPANMAITAKAVGLKETTDVYMGAAQIGKSSRSTLPLLEPEQSLTAELPVNTGADGARSRSTLPPMETDRRLGVPIKATVKPSGYCSRAVLPRLE